MARPGYPTQFRRKVHDLLAEDVASRPTTHSPQHPPPTATPSSARRGRQNLDRQIQALETAGCAKNFADHKTGKNAQRPN